MIATLEITNPLIKIDDYIKNLPHDCNLLELLINFNRQKEINITEENNDD